MTLSFPNIRSALKLLHFQDSVDSLPTMNGVLASIISTLLVALRSRLALQAEILALRHQLNVFKRSIPARRLLRPSDRILWVWLSRLWSDWLSALLIVKPETVIRWHRQVSLPTSPSELNLAYPLEARTRDVVPDWLKPVGREEAGNHRSSVERRVRILLLSARLLDAGNGRRDHAARRSQR